ncbi:MAG: helix-turn-helix domain-containing protein [Rhodospirillales bacterium]|nr:helix-turn-helix domain-containing protein [Rhodospirillales bacterium]
MSSAGPRSGAIAIGELAQRTGCNIETIRYYERIGLLPMPGRKGRFRRYGGEDVKRLAFVRRARELGFTLNEVRALLSLAAGNGDACGEVRAIAAAHLADVRAKIADLRTMEGVLADAVRQCDAGEAPGCPLIDVLASDPPPAAR